MPAAEPADRSVLTVYVSQHCFGCAEARRLAAAVAQAVPELAVRVVDLDREPQARPAGLIAVPTFMLDGRAIALGNPRQQDLLRQVRALRPPADLDGERAGAP